MRELLPGRKGSGPSLRLGEVPLCTVGVEDGSGPNSPLRVVAVIAALLDVATVPGNCRLNRSGDVHASNELLKTSTLTSGTPDIATGTLVS